MEKSLDFSDEDPYIQESKLISLFFNSDIEAVVLVFSGGGMYSVGAQSKEVGLLVD